MRAAVGSHNPRFELGPLAGRLVIDALAISQIIESRGVPSLLAYFTGTPPGRAWTEPGAVSGLGLGALPEGRPEPCAVALNAADVIIRCSSGLLVVDGGEQRGVSADQRGAQVREQRAVAQAALPDSTDFFPTTSE